MAVYQMQYSLKFLFCEAETDSLHFRGDTPINLTTPISELLKIGSTLNMISLEEKKIPKRRDITTPKAVQ